MIESRIDVVNANDPLVALTVQTQTPTGSLVGYDLTGLAVEFYLKRSSRDPDSAAVAVYDNGSRGGVTVSVPAQGQLQVQLRSVALVAPTLYYHLDVIRLTLRNTVLEGPLVVANAPLSTLTDADLAYIRSEIGTATPPTDAELEALYLNATAVAVPAAPPNLLMTQYDPTPPNPVAVAVAAQVLRGRLADLLNGASSMSIPGFYSEDYKAAIEGITARLKVLDPTFGSRVVSRRLVRPDQARTPSRFGRGRLL